MEPGDGGKGKVNPTFISARVCCCVCLSTGEIREMHANSEYRIMEFAFVFDWWENVVTLDIQISRQSCRRGK